MTPLKCEDRLFNRRKNEEKRFGLDQLRPSTRIRVEETRGDLNIFVNHLIEVETFKSIDPFDPSSTNSNAPHTSSAIDTLSPLTRRSDRIGWSIESVYSALHSRNTQTTKIKLHHALSSIDSRFSETQFDSSREKRSTFTENSDRPVYLNERSCSRSCSLSAGSHSKLAAISAKGRKEVSC